MGNVNFLNDDASCKVIIRLTSELTRLWAPDEAELVDVVAEEYFRQAQIAGRVLYPAKTSDWPLELGRTELWILVILPVAIEFMGNLLAEFAVETFKELRSRITQRQRSKEKEKKLGPEEICSLIKREAEASGLSSEQIEQLAQLFSNVISELLLANSGGLESNVKEPA